jgi:hypothetical protein
VTAFSRFYRPPVTGHAVTSELCLLEDAKIWPSLHVYIGACDPKVGGND